MSYFYEVACVISLFWTFMPQQRIKLMIWRAASMKNWNVFDESHKYHIKFC
jgi:hypothetical protein